MWVCVWVCVWVGVQECVCKFVCMRMCLCMSMCLYVSVWARVCVRVCVTCFLRFPRSPPLHHFHVGLLSLLWMPCSILIAVAPRCGVVRRKEALAGLFGEFRDVRLSFPQTPCTFALDWTGQTPFGFSCSSPTLPAPFQWAPDGCLRFSCTIVCQRPRASLSSSAQTPIPMQACGCWWFAPTCSLGFVGMA